MRINLRRKTPQSSRAGLRAGEAGRNGVGKGRGGEGETAQGRGAGGGDDGPGHHSGIHDSPCDIPAIARPATNAPKQLTRT